MSTLAQSTLEIEQLRSKTSYYLELFETDEKKELAYGSSDVETRIVPDSKIT